MSLNALARELKFGLGFGAQADIATASTAAAIWTVKKNNGDMVNPRFVTEDDAAEYGKGHEFATETIKSHTLVGPFTVEKYLSAEIMAWAAAFGLGKVVKSGTTPNFVYTCTPLDKTTAGLELPYFTAVEQIRTSTDALINRAYVGCALNSFQVDVQTGPGRGSSRISLSVLGSGKITDPSTITLPATLSEKLLPSASLALTLIGENYVSLKDIVSYSMGWNNNLMADTMFYPGSGTQNGYAIGGRIESGDRSAFLNLVVRMHKDSAEYTKLAALTTGTAVITQTYDSNNTFTATFQQVGIRAVDMGETNGIVTLAIECSAQWHTTNGVLTIVAKVAKDGICEEES